MVRQQAREVVRRDVRGEDDLARERAVQHARGVALDLPGADQGKLAAGLRPAQAHGPRGHAARPEGPGLEVEEVGNGVGHPLRSGRRRCAPAPPAVGGI